MQLLPSLDLTFPSPPPLLEFTRLCQQWNTTDWSWLVAFKADMSLYKGDFESFRKILQHERQKAKTNEKDKVRESTLTFLFLIILNNFPCPTA